MSVTDDSGRSDEDPGFALQARIFALIGVFLTGLSIFYGILTREWAGATMLALSSGLAFTTGGYIGWWRRAPGAEGGEAAEEEPWFPSASIWPVTIALGAVLVANGLLLGAWLLLPAVAFLTYAIGGFVLQGRHRT